VIHVYYPHGRNLSIFGLQPRRPPDPGWASPEIGILLLLHRKRRTVARDAADVISNDY